MVKAPYFTRLDEDRYWPEDLRWVRDALGITGGTPRFIVVIDRTIATGTFGTGSWSHSIYPLLQRLVAQKTGG